MRKVEVPVCMKRQSKKMTRRCAPRAYRDSPKAAGGVAACLLTILLCGFGNPCAYAADSKPAGGGKLPRPDHVVIVVEENRSYSRIIGNLAARYINALANRGALFAQSFGISHPSQPNYLALFSGSTQNITDNSCPHTLSGDNLASALLRAGLTFGIYSEAMPSAGYAGCVYGHYQRKHNPVANWQGTNMPPAVNMPFTDFPPDYSRLPTVSLVIPNQENDMHDGAVPATIGRGDAWLKTRLDAYVRWAETHNSLLIVTWDEDDGSEGNRIPTIFVGPMVKRGVYSQRIDHYSVLRVILDMYSLPPLGNSAQARPIDYIWSYTQEPGRLGK
jgi:phosphatidylinositol-3-phosphatase